MEAAKHDAFISYNHFDHALAKALEEGMERLAKPLLSLRAIDVFRDETGLAANPDLWAGIIDHLTGTKWLVLLACPEWAGSYWCGREALWWIENHSPERILIVLIGGEIAWDRERNDFDWSVTTALNEGLSGRFHEEPLYVDLRWARGQDGLTLSNLQFRDAVLNLSATIRGIAKDKLDGEDVRQLRRNRRLVRAGVTAIAIAAAVAAWQAVVATLERNTARSRELAAQSQLQLTDVEAFPRLAALLALESQRIEENPVANQSLQTSLSRLPPPHMSTMALGLNRKVTRAAFSPDSRTLAAVTEGQFAGEPTRVELWDAAGGRQVAAWEAAQPLTALSFSDDGRHLVFAGDDNATTIVDIESGKVVRQVRALNRSWAWAGSALRVLATGAKANVVRVVDAIADRELATITAPAAIKQATMSADGTRVATTTDDGQLAVWRISGGAATAAWQIATHGDGPIFSADGKKLAAVVDDKAAAVFEAESGKTLERIAGGDKVIGATFSPGGQYVLVAEDPGRIRVFDLMLHKPILVVGGRTNELTVNDMIDVTQRSPIVDVAFAGDDRFFLAVRSDGVVTQYRRGATLGAGTFGVNFFDHAETMRVSAGKSLKQTGLGQDGRYLITTAGGNTMKAGGTMDLADYKTRVWDLSDGREGARITSERAIGVVATSPDGRFMATQSYAAVIEEPGKKAEPSLELHTWRLMDPIGSDAIVSPAPNNDVAREMRGGSLSLDGRHAVAITDTALMLWDAEHGLRKLALPDSATPQTGARAQPAQRGARFSDDGEVLVATDGRSVFVFRTSDGGLIGRKDFDGTISALVLDRAGRTAGVTLVHLELVKPEQRFDGTSPPGALVTRIWKVADGTDIATIEHTTATGLVALSRDGGTAAFLISPAIRKEMEELGKHLRDSIPLRVSLVFWDVSRGRAMMGAPMQADDLITGAAFSDDGNTLITVHVPVVMVLPGPMANGGGSFGMWNARSGRRIAPPHVGVPKSLIAMFVQAPRSEFDRFQAAFGFTPDGHSVMVTEQATEPGPVPITTRRFLWQTADLVRLVCERLPAGQRALTADEVRRLLPGESYRPTCPP